jgi:hypothetical protein
MLSDVWTVRSIPEACLGSGPALPPSLSQTSIAAL